jgi:protein O-GlcNAc transferase
MIMGKASFNLPETLRRARTSYKAQDLEQAAQACQTVIQHFPAHLEAHYLLSRIFYDAGRNEEALRYLQKAFSYDNQFLSKRQEYFDILGRYLQNRQFELLEQASVWLTTFNPRDGIAWDFLGISRIEQAKFPEAYVAQLQAVAILPDNPHVLCNLGNILISLERCAEAVPVLRKAIQIAPDMLVAYNNLGNALRFIGQTKASIESLTKAMQLNPGVPYVHNNLGLAYREDKQCAAAIACFHKALELQPDLYQVYPNLIDALRQNGQVQEAIDCSERAMQYCENIPEYWGGYGDALREANHLNAAIEAYIKALAFKADSQSSFNRKIYSNLLFCLNYHPDMSAETIYSAYREYDQRFGVPYRSTWKPFANVRDPAKRLKVGYVAQSFYNQVCKYFLLPLLEKHDRSQVEVFAYANPPFEDETTAYYKTIVDHWVPTREMTDDELAQRIRDDGIDVLVDVAAHTNNNRLLVFARKPAPVSLHWLEYGYTTGLSAIDYYLTDKPSVTDNSAHLFSEKIWCLDGPAYTYRPDVRRAELTPSPCLEAGVITFGTLSRSARINHKVVRIWSAILDAMPNSRLIINSADFQDVKVQDEMASRFTRYGIDRSRLLISFTSPSWDVLKHIDIGLDCFPHNSGTTLLESLYMGIPFISLVDRPTVGRIGASILTGAGHPEWIAYSEEEYAQKAIILAHDVEALCRHRQNLRTEMQASSLMDENAFARSVEKAFRQMWQIYCKEGAQ